MSLKAGHDTDTASHVQCLHAAQAPIIYLRSTNNKLQNPVAEVVLVMPVSKLASQFCCALACGDWVQTTSMYRVLDTHYRHTMDSVLSTVYTVQCTESHCE